MLEILNSDIIKYGAFLLGMVTAFYVIIDHIQLNKKFLLTVILGFFLGGIWMWLLIGGYNKFLFPMFGIISNIIIGAIIYREKLILYITKFNVIILLIVIMSMVIKYGSPDINIGMAIFLGIFLLPYIFFIPYLTGLSKIGHKGKFILYFLSWTTIIILCWIFAPDFILILNDNSINSNSGLSEIVSKFIVPKGKDTNILDLFAKGLITTYLGLVIIYALGIYFNEKEIKKNNKKFEGNIIKKFNDFNATSKEMLQGIGIVIFIIIINQLFHLVNDYTLTSLILFLNLGVYNKLIKKRKSERKKLLDII